VTDGETSDFWVSVLETTCCLYNKSIIYIIYQERKTFDLYFWEEINCFLNTLKYSYEIVFTFQIYMNIVPYGGIQKIKHYVQKEKVYKKFNLK
jgi:hypothetical protein